MPNVNLDDRKTPSKAIYSPHGSVMSYGGTVAEGTDLIGLKLGTDGQSVDDDLFTMSPMTPGAGLKVRSRLRDDLVLDDKYSAAHGKNLSSRGHFLT